jgi:hypothetical protein
MAFAQLSYNRDKQLRDTLNIVAFPRVLHTTPIFGFSNKRKINLPIMGTEDLPSCFLSIFIIDG